MPFVRAYRNRADMSAQTLSLFPVTALQIQSYCHFGQSGPSRLSDRVELEMFRDLHRLHSHPFQLHSLIRFAKLHIFAALPFSCIAFTSRTIPRTGLALNLAMFLAVWEASLLLTLDVVCYQEFWWNRFIKRDVDTRNGLECCGLSTVYERDKGEDEKNRLVLMFSSIVIRM